MSVPSATLSARPVVSVEVRLGAAQGCDRMRIEMDGHEDRGPGEAAAMRASCSTRVASMRSRGTTGARVRRSRASAGRSSPTPAGVHRTRCCRIQGELILGEPRPSRADIPSGMARIERDVDQSAWARADLGFSGPGAMAALTTRKSATAAKPDPYRARTIMDYHIDRHAPGRPPPTRGWRGPPSGAAAQFTSLKAASLDPPALRPCSFSFSSPQTRFLRYRRRAAPQRRPPLASASSRKRLMSSRRGSSSRYAATLLPSAANAVVIEVRKASNAPAHPGCRSVVRRPPRANVGALCRALLPGMGGAGRRGSARNTCLRCDPCDDLRRPRSAHGIPYARYVP
jgi:hypothetical protein